MRWLSSLELLSRTPVLLCTGGLAILLSLQMAHTLGPIGGTAELLRLQWTPDAGTYREIVAAWGPAGRHAFASHFGTDFLFMLAYTLFGVGITARLLPHRPGAVAGPRLTLLPAAIALADLAETLFHGLLLANWESPAGAWVALAFGLNVVKWSLVALFIATLLSRISAGAGRARRNRDPD